MEKKIASLDIIMVKSVCIRRANAQYEIDLPAVNEKTSTPKRIYILADLSRYFLKCIDSISLRHSGGEIPLTSACSSESVSKHLEMAPSKLIFDFTIAAIERHKIIEGLKLFLTFHRLMLGPVTLEIYAVHERKVEIQ